MKIKKMTLVRTMILVTGLINMILTMAGKSPLPFSDQQITDFISGAWASAAIAWAWWKNNSFTENAIEADEYLDLLRSGEYMDDGTKEVYFYEDDDEPVDLNEEGE